ncbi:uncharacterized protein LOC143620791 [Bidens hawaiensis]|uniref:uncharacterized protein LOC143620791 n=1 Tax=Bidens hawaiensis TaxID=980011 RepID=UPI00404A81CF
MSGRMAKWAVKLSAYDIQYEPRNAIKSHALADFVADFSSDLEEQANLDVQQLEETKDPWTLFTDEASNVKGTRLGILLKSPQGDILPNSIACEFQATNNLAEYEALIADIQLAKGMRVGYFEIYVDSLLIANHFNGSYVVKGADALANLSSALKLPEDVKIPIIHVPSSAIEECKAMKVDGNLPRDHEDHAHDDASWILPVKKYIQDGEIPKGENPKAFKAKVDT